MTQGTAPVGGEIDAWCTRCKRELNHTVVAKVKDAVRRVQCLTCASQHNYRPSGAAPARRKSPVARKRPAAAVDDLDREAIPYLMSGIYAAGDILLHATHGRGRVVARRGNKIDVDFASGTRTLVLGVPSVRPVAP